MSTKRIDAYEIYCDDCGDRFESEFTIWVDAADGIAEAVGSDWFERTEVERKIPPSVEHPRGLTIERTVELICPSCPWRCDVCKEIGAYEVGGHLVCDEHEDHNFEGDDE